MRGDYFTRTLNAIPHPRSQCRFHRGPLRVQLLRRALSRGRVENAHRDEQFLDSVTVGLKKKEFGDKEEAHELQEIIVMQKEDFICTLPA